MFTAPRGMSRRDPFRTEVSWDEVVDHPLLALGELLIPPDVLHQEHPPPANAAIFSSCGV